MPKTTYSELVAFVQEIDKQNVEKISMFEMRSAMKKFFNYQDRTITNHLQLIIDFGFYKIEDPYLVRTKKKGK